jgi:hypothetical protein
MAETDVFQFSKLKLFEEVSKTLPDGANQILDIYEDLVFVWNSKNGNLKVTNWRSAQACKDGNIVKCQVLYKSKM